MGAFLRCQQRKLAVPLGASTVATAVNDCRRRNGAAGGRDRLRLRVHDDGRVRCCSVRVGRRNSPPSFHGHLEESVDGVTLRGAIRESRSARAFPVMYTTGALFMAVIAVACVVAHPIVVPGLVICAIAAVLLGLLGLALRSGRVPTFQREAHALEMRIRQQFDAVPGRPAGW